MLGSEVLICEFGSVDGFSTGAIEGGEVSSLAHEAGDDSVENGAFVVEWLAGLASAFFTGAKSSEVLSSFRDNVVVQFEDDSSERRA